MSTTVICVMDDLASIKPEKDTTFALLLEARRRGLEVWYANERDLELNQGNCVARIRRVELNDRSRDWFSVEETRQRALGRSDLILMRCDPPVDDTYVYTTLLLDRAVADGARVINRPQALRDFNEKLAIARFADLIPETRVSANPATLRQFVIDQGRAVLKPLDGMGGRGIFLARDDDPNLNVILETLTADGRKPAMAQEFLPGISKGDKRILMIAGQAVPYVLARIPSQADFRGNLARGGRGEGQPINDAERHIAERVGPELLKNGVDFAGLDVIDGRLTEINVTSPTCVRELDRR
ncbi:MAG: glutathione synthase [Xanthomonadaceae bacterium]|nr:glutathione synthase [Xanthomonadaceae bacterium]